MAPHVIGRSAFNIRHTGQIMFEDFAIRRGSLELLSAWSAIEIASWDIVGKRAGLPVYNLLGGASRERVRVYANGWSRGSTIEEGVERGAQGQGDGLHRRQIRPVPRPVAQLCRSPGRGFRDRLCPRDARGAGPRFRDCWSRRIAALRRRTRSASASASPNSASTGTRSRACADNIDLVAEVRRAVPIPIVTGEAIYTKEAFFECLAQRAADILNPDICAIGGISAMLDIAAMAQPHAVVMAPHNYNSTARRPGGDGARLGGDPEFPDRRVLRQFRRICAATSPPPRWRSRTAGSTCRPRPGSASTSMSTNCAPTRTRRRPHHGFRQYWEEYPRKGYAPSLR